MISSLLNIGYLLPIVPFMVMVAARPVGWLSKAGHLGHLPLGMLLVWLVCAAAADWPRYVGSFNALAGNRPYMLFKDSNLSWLHSGWSVDEDRVEGLLPVDRIRPFGVRPAGANRRESEAPCVLFDLPQAPRLDVAREHVGAVTGELGDASRLASGSCAQVEDPLARLRVEELDDAAAELWDIRRPATIAFRFPSLTALRHEGIVHDGRGW